MSTKKVLALLGASAAVAFLAVASMTSVSIIQGQGTDVGTDVPRFNAPRFSAPTAVPAPPSLPPATNLPPAPVEQPTSGQAPAAAQLPAAGSGGMLDENGGAQVWLVLMAAGAALVGLGGLASLRFHKR